MDWESNQKNRHNKRKISKKNGMVRAAIEAAFFAKKRFLNDGAP